MISRLQLSRRFAALALVILCSCLSIGTPVRKRIVTKLSRPNEPIELIAVKVKGKPVQFGKAFTGNNNWIGGLAVVVKNKSTKPVNWVKVAVSFHKDKYPDVRLVDSIIYGVGRSDIEKLRGGGPPLQPGETAEASYSLNLYKSVRPSLDGMGYPRSIAEVNLSVQQVSFVGEDEVMWIEGQMCKEDYHSPTGWSPVKL